ncbi:MAG TPA: thioesterase family protein [Opitutales bacterium]|nr:thioesterase family protein [Opitutales bacterium]
MISSKTEIRVRYAETDMMGIAYHGNYLTWFEVARVNMLDELGCPYRDLELLGYRLPVLEVSLRYLRSLTFDDRAIIEAVIREKPALRIHVDYTISRGDETIATGSTKHAFVSPEGKPRRPPAEFLAAVERHF